MPALFTHCVVGLAAATAWGTGTKPRPQGLLAISALCAGLPDADIIGNRLGMPFGSMLGHRGFSHSFLFAAVLAAVVMFAWFRKERPFTGLWWGLFGFLFAVTASHGVLDMLVHGAQGIPLLSPFDNTRFPFSWQPLMVSPVKLRELWSRWLLQVLWIEIPRIWLPAFCLAGIWRGAWSIRRGDLCQAPKAGR